VVPHAAVPTAAEPGLAAMIRFKATLLRQLRQFLADQDAWEVPMPILHRTREGAPIDQWRALRPGSDQVWHLRHCMEDHLRRAVAAHPRVYEIGKAIRADAVDATHAHEFLVLELVCRQLPYAEGIALVAAMCAQVLAPVAEEVYGRGAMFAEPAVRTWDEICQQATGLDSEQPDFLTAAGRWLKAHDLAPARPYTRDWEVLEDLMRHAIEPACTTPTIITEFPAVLQHVCDLADDPGGRAMRVSTVVNGVEISDGGVKFATSAEYRRIYQSNADYRHDVLGLDHNELPDELLADLDAIGEPVFTTGMGLDRITALVAGADIRQALIFEG
jgi:lysyl-tRNA synthetase class II